MSETILRTRLYRPKITADIVIRKNLLENLEQNQDRPLTLVSAPAGHGKSTLVSSWIEYHQKNATWVSVDENNNSLSQLLIYIIEAVIMLYPKSMKETKRILSARELPPRPKIANTISLDLDQIREPVLLVLDDFHRIHDIDVIELLDILLQHPPHNLHLVIISRKDPGLDLYELRTSNKINEIRARDLRFSLEESDKFLEHIYGRKFDSTLVGMINRKIDGWVAGLRILSSSIENIDDINFSDSNIDEFFNLEEMIDRFLEAQSSEGQTFMLKSSIFEKFCSPLCDYACFDQDDSVPESMSQPFLEWMEETNLFTICMDDQKYWYRFHHLFRDALYMNALNRYGDGEIEKLHIRAGEWFGKNHMLEEAITHFLKGNQRDMALSLFAKHRIKLQDGRHWPELERIVKLFTPDLIENNIELALTNAWILIYKGKTLDMFDKLPSIESIFHDIGKTHPEKDNLSGELKVLQSYKIYNVEMDYRRVHDLTHSAIDQIDPKNYYPLGLAWIFYGGAHQSIGQSEACINRIYEVLHERKKPALLKYLHMALHYILLLDGDISKLIINARQSFQFAEEIEDLEYQANSGYFLGMALYLINNINEALIVLEKAYAVRFQTLGIHHFNIAAALIYCYLKKNRMDRVNHLLEEVREYTMTTHSPYMILLSDVLETEINWRTGNKEKSLKWLDKNKDIPIYPFTNFFIPLFTQIKLLIYQDNADSLKKAAELLQNSEKLIMSTGNQHFRIEVFALQAMLDFEMGREEEAFQNLKRSLKIAESEEVIQVYLDMGPKMVHLLNQLSKRETTVKFIAKILTAYKDNELNRISEPQTRREEDESQVLASFVGTNLTKRENEILSLMSRHLQNKEIAEKLFISTETVKKHTKKIYQKLHVHNRRQAVEKAGALGMI
jgi:LuxR family maltose regulon positive regulatory protein